MGSQSNRTKYEYLLEYQLVSTTKYRYLHAYGPRHFSVVWLYAVREIAHIAQPENIDFASTICSSR